MKRTLILLVVLHFAVSSAFANESPWVKAVGPQQATTGELVVLTGWAEDRDRDKVRFHWEQAHDHAPHAIVQYPENSTAYFVPEKPGVYRFRLCARDGRGGFNSDTTTVFVSPKPIYSHGYIHSLIHHANRQQAWKQSVYDRLGVPRPAKDGLADYVRERGIE